MWKRGEIAPKEQFLLFSTLFYIYIFLTSGVKLHIHLLNVAVQFIVFITLSTLICWGMDISKFFSESLEIRDNESRLYLDSDHHALPHSPWSIRAFAAFDHFYKYLKIHECLYHTAWMCRLLLSTYVLIFLFYRMNLERRDLWPRFMRSLKNLRKQQWINS